MELTPAEARVLGCLIEKRATTPDQYPLSTNALVNACNQKTNREPVMDLSERDVVNAMMELRANKLCRTVSSGRTDKHKHILEEAMGLEEQQLAALAIMLLRGPQTPGEIRTRTDRYVGFESVEAVDEVLAGLTTTENPLVVDLGRGPGQSQNRFMHLLTGEVDAEAAHAYAHAAGAPASPSGPSRTDRISELETAVAALIVRVDQLESELGIQPPVGAEVEHEATIAHDL